MKLEFEDVIVTDNTISYEYKGITYWCDVVEVVKTGRLPKKMWWNKIGHKPNWEPKKKNHIMAIMYNHDTGKFLYPDLSKVTNVEEW